LLIVASAPAADAWALGAKKKRKKTGKTMVGHTNKALARQRQDAYLAHRLEQRSQARRRQQLRSHRDFKGLMEFIQRQPIDLAETHRRPGMTARRNGRVRGRKSVKQWLMGSPPDGAFRGVLLGVVADPADPADHALISNNTPDWSHFQEIGIFLGGDGTLRVARKARIPNGELWSVTDQISVSLALEHFGRKLDPSELYPEDAALKEIGRSMRTLASEKSQLQQSFVYFSNSGEFSF
jgi:hypothetical protein